MPRYTVVTLASVAADFTLEERYAILDNDEGAVVTHTAHGTREPLILRSRDRAKAFARDQNTRERRHRRDLARLAAMRDQIAELRDRADARLAGIA